MDPLKVFIQRITEIAEIIRPLFKSKQALKLFPRTARLIDSLLEADAPVVEFIRANLALTHGEMKKTPMYFLHRQALPRKDRLRKQDFLMLYEYLKRRSEAETEAEAEEEEEEEEQWYRASATGSYAYPDAEIRIWIYTHNPDEKNNIKPMWDRAIRNSIRLTNLSLIAKIDDSMGMEFEEVDEDEVLGTWEKWVGKLIFNVESDEFDDCETLGAYVYDVL